jgi:hypothetical protein
MACKSCESLSIDELFERTHTAPGHWILHPSFELLETAANDGCHSCQAFHKHFSEGFPYLKERLVQLQQSRGTNPPVIVFLHMAFSQVRNKQIHKLHAQIGDQPDRPGIEPLRISFRVCRPRGTIAQMKVSNRRAT